MTMHLKTEFLAILAGVFITIWNSANGQPDLTIKSELTEREQSISVISALTATGKIEQLENQFNAGLDAGLTIEEVKEVLVQLYAYCGFPRSLNAINSLMKVVEERKAKGTKDVPGKTFKASNKNADTYEEGRKVLEKLTNMPQSKPAPGFGVFAPRVDAFLKEHLFANIFSSDVLSYKERELVTISALAAMPGVTSQLQAHVEMGANVGVLQGQVSEVAELIEKHVGRTQANILRKIIGKPVMPVIEEDMLVRISEIEIAQEFLAEYNSILKEEAAASIAKEPGVLAIFPMAVKSQPNQIRIIEIYANQAAYQSHLKTPHFQHYKSSTLEMVKSLKLIDMSTLDQQMMPVLFKKVN
jgi:4-carboxymuconolactone decarboxylase